MYLIEKDQQLKTQSVQIKTMNKRLNDLERRTNEMLSVDYRNNNIYNAPKLKEVRKKLDLLTFPCAKKQESLNQ